MTVSLTVLPYNTQLLVNGSFESNYTGWTQSGNSANRRQHFLWSLGWNQGGRDSTSARLLQTRCSRKASELSRPVYRLSFDMGAVGGTITQTCQVDFDRNLQRADQSFSVRTGGSTNNWASQTLTLHCQQRDHHARLRRTFPRPATRRYDARQCPHDRRPAQSHPHGLLLT